MSWQDKALSAFWDPAFANETLDSHRRIEAAIAAAAASLLPCTDAPMTDHPITPPPELLQQWAVDYWGNPGESIGEGEKYIATQAARWGADQELEACCEVLARELICDGKHVATDLRAARRPKPPSLAGQALDTLRSMQIEPVILNGINVNKDVMDQYSIVRRALERLQELEDAQ